MNSLVNVNDRHTCIVLLVPVLLVFLLLVAAYYWVTVHLKVTYLSRSGTMASGIIHSWYDQ